MKNYIANSTTHTLTIHNCIIPRLTCAAEGGCATLARDDKGEWFIFPQLNSLRKNALFLYLCDHLRLFISCFLFLFTSLIVSYRTFSVGFDLLPTRLPLNRRCENRHAGHPPQVID